MIYKKIGVLSFQLMQQVSARLKMALDIS